MTRFEELFSEHRADVCVSMVDAPSPGTGWQSVFGDAFSPTARRRNKKLTQYTPDGNHLAAQSWLARHQEKAQNKLERKVQTRLVKLRHVPKPGDGGGSGAASALPLRIGNAACPRMPPRAERGAEPQVLAFELDVLAERFRESLFDKHLCTSARPGLVEAGQRLRERFLLCALSRAPAHEATELLSTLHDRGLTFDYAFTLPPPEGTTKHAARRAAHSVARLSSSPSCWRRRTSAGPAGASDGTSRPGPAALGHTGRTTRSVYCGWPRRGSSDSLRCRDCHSSKSLTSPPSTSPKPSTSISRRRHSRNASASALESHTVAGSG